MKKLLLPLGILISLFFTQKTLLAQAPEAINYQAIARNLAGNPLISTPVNLQFDILQGSATGAAAYSETQTLTTNQFGLFTAQIGTGTVISGVFANILWGSNPYYLRVTVNGDVMPATQLLSVPYALYAKASAGGPQGVPGINCWDTNGNGVQDPAEDINGDLVWDALDCQGDTGLAGTNGIGVTWLGSFSTAPVGSINDAYYNSTDGISYIFNGVSATWDTLVSSGGSIADNDWIIVGNSMSSGITGNVGIGILTPNKKLSVRSAVAGGDGISINNIGTGDPGLQFETQGVPYFVLGIDQSDNNKFKIGTTGVNTSPRFTIDNVGNIGIGTITPSTKLDVIGKIKTDSIRIVGGAAVGNVLTSDVFGNATWQPLTTSLSPWTKTLNNVYPTTLTNNVGIGLSNPTQKLTVFSPDSVIASFTSSSPNFSAIALTSTSNADLGILMLSGADTTILGYIPSQKMAVLDNSKIGGHIALNADSSVISYAKVVGASASGKIYNKTPAIYNETDSIYSYSATGTILNVNQGMFYTDSLYVLGNNSFMPNWILANDGTGQAKWTNPSLIGGGSLWQQNSPHIYFNTGNVGIGNPNPAFPLDVTATSSARAAYFLNNSMSTPTNHGVYATSFNGGTDNYAFYGIANAAGVANATGVYAAAGGSGNGITYGVYGNNSSTSTGLSYGGYFQNFNNTSPQVYGVRTNVNSTSTGSIYGVRADVVGTSSTNVYGFYTNQTITSPGTQYGLYSSVTGGTTNWAGYFAQGGVYIGQNLVIPTGAAAGSVLTSDATGNATWQSSVAPLSLWTNTNGNIYPLTITDSIGIGTATPLAKLHVAGGGIMADWSNPAGADPNLAVVNVNGGSPGYSGGTLGQVTIAASPTAEPKYAIQGIAGGTSGNAYAIAAIAAGTGANNYGIQAQAYGAVTNWAGFFGDGSTIGSGNVYIQDKLGIGALIPAATLDVNGTFKLTDGTQGAGKILSSDAAGNASWKTNQIGFEAYLINSYVLPASIGLPQPVLFDTPSFNDGGGFLAATGEFIAPVAGVYSFQVTLNCFLSGIAAPEDMVASIFLNGAPIKGVQQSLGAPAYNVVTLSITLNLVAGDKIAIHASDQNNSATIGGQSTWFSGHLVYAY